MLDSSSDLVSPRAAAKEKRCGIGEGDKSMTEDKKASVSIGGTEYFIAPVSKKVFTLCLLPFAGKGIEEMEPVSACTAVTKIIHAALKPFYPEMTQDDVEGLVDFVSVIRILEAIRSISDWS